MITPTRRIVIEGNVIRSEQITILSEAPLSSLAPHLITQLPTAFPILPHGTRFIGYHPALKRGLLMVETLPTTINMKLMTNARGLRTFRIQVPYQYFLYAFDMTTHLEQDGQETLLDFTIRHSYLYWRSTPYRAMDDTLWHAQIPNIGNDSSICWGGTGGSAQSLNERIDYLTNSFADTEFNGDLGLKTPEYGTDFGAWQNASATDPMLYMKWNMWTNDANSTTLDAIWRNAGPSYAPVAITSPAFVDLPQLPTNFTIGRAIEVLNTLTDAQRRRFTMAIQLMNQPTTPEPPEEDPMPNMMNTNTIAIPDLAAMARTLTNQEQP